MLRDWTSPHAYSAGSTIKECSYSVVILTEKMFQHVERPRRWLGRKQGDEQGERRKESLYLFWDTGRSCEPFLPTLPLAVGPRRSTTTMSTPERNRITSGLEIGTDKTLVQAGKSAGVTPLSHKNVSYCKSFSHSKYSMIL